jgi:pimeloyl-ACP methyl ester carboxylesterase
MPKKHVLADRGAAVMSADGSSRRAFLRRVAPFCAVTASVIENMLPIGAAAQAPGDPSTITLKLYARTLERPGAPPINYVIAIPPNYSPATPVPLILALHFGVGNGEATGAGGDVVQALVGPALAELGAIIVAPDSVRGNWSTPENEKAVNALLDMVIDQYAIDKRKVAVTGYSMGGTGSWHFAEKFPERFSAAIPIASRPPASAAEWRLPVFAIHSDADQVAPFAPVAARIEELQKAGVNAKMVALGGITHYQVPRFRGALHQAIPWLQEVWK